MRKWLVLVLCCSGVAIRAHITTSRTFFSIYPPFQCGSPEHILLFFNPLYASFNNNKIQKNVWSWSNCWGGTVQATVFGGRSTRPKELARYFLPFNKTEIIAGEFGSQAFINNTIDVIANYFGVLTANPLAGNTPLPPPPAPANTSFITDDLTFQSTIKLKPQHSFAGLGLQYRQYVTRRDDGSGCWIQISAPIMWVKNVLNFVETIINKGAQGTPQVPTGFVGSIQDALLGKPVFGDKVFKFGKIAVCGERTKVGVADIQLTFGCMHVQHEQCFLQWYAGITIPTGNKPKARFIFEPIVGNNRHVGVHFGTVNGFAIAQNNTSAIWLYTRLQGQYLFHNTQTRSFDLISKHWSRYIWVYANKDAVPFADLCPGINFLTREVEVRPGFTGMCSVRLAHFHGQSTVQLGYRLFGRANEKIEFCSSFCESFGIAGIDFDDVSNTGAGKNGKANTQSRANIRLFEDALNDEDAAGLPAFVPIKAEDIDPESAAHPCILTHTIHGTAGYQWEVRDCFVHAGIGMSYEFSGATAVLNRWMVWASCGVSF